jgi:uncharacterized protein
MRPVTVIVFTREPIAGKTKTRLTPALGAEGAAALADAFTRDAVAKAAKLIAKMAASRAARLVIAASSPRGASQSAYFRTLARESGALLVDQGSGDLGSRMARMLRRFAGRHGAILFGTDTPSLPLALLARSAQLLAQTAVVIAPALDGGYYLVGVRGSIPDIFAGMTWGGASVLRQTLRRLRAAHAAYTLGPWWYDVDRARDLPLLRAHLGRHLSHAAAHAMPLGPELPCPATAALMRRFDI